MKNSQYKIDELNVLAHHAETTNSNIQFTAQQIKDIIRIILDLQGQIIDLEALQYRELNDDEIIEIWDKVNYESQYYEASNNFALEFAKAILERAKTK